MTTESKNKVVAHTGWSKGGQGEYPVRFVILKWKDKDPQYGVYSVHMQVKDNVHPEYYISGTYDLHYPDAVDVLKKRQTKNNADFKVGNVSHIPGPITKVGK